MTKYIVHTNESVDRYYEVMAETKDDARLRWGMGDNFPCTDGDTETTVVDVFPDRHATPEGILAKLKADVGALDAKLDDPRGDGSGDGAVPPDGDSYNKIHSIVVDALKRLEALAGGAK